MEKLIFILLATVFLVKVVSGCQWVCIDKNNNIKKHYMDERKLRLEHLVPVIEVPSYPKHVWKLNITAGPEITLRMPSFDVAPLPVSCSSKEFAKNFKDVTKHIKCLPRDTIVDIVYEGAKVVPNKVGTKLCRGVCSGSKTCLSIERKNMTVPVTTILPNGQAQCSTVIVPKDTKCKCGCDIKQSDCSSTQIFDKKFCKCKCTNEEDYNSCRSKIIKNNGKKFTWNKNTCSCQCLHEKVCTTGTIWNKNDCKCERIF